MEQRGRADTQHENQRNENVPKVGESPRNVHSDHHVRRHLHAELKMVEIDTFVFGRELAGRLLVLQTLSKLLHFRFGTAMVVEGEERAGANDQTRNGDSDRVQHLCSSFHEIYTPVGEPDRVSVRRCGARELRALTRPGSPNWSVGAPLFPATANGGAAPHLPDSLRDNMPALRAAARALRCMARRRTASATSPSGPRTQRVVLRASAGPGRRTCRCGGSHSVAPTR